MANTNDDPQIVCINLPGEDVDCWRQKDKIKVVLRKHRDVIFDLHLGKGKTYTVEATDSDFYNQRDKKLVYALRKEKVHFKDGERMHIWVTRGFQGALVLKCDNVVVMKLEPNEVDRHQYGNDPKTKPLPIIIALGKAPAAAPPVKPATTPAQTVQRVPVTMPQPAAASVDENCSIVCVLEGSTKGMPKAIADHFANGGGTSGLADIDPFDAATSNWIWGQVAGATATIKTNWAWLRASLDFKTKSGFKLVSAKIHYVRGKVRFYFSGYSTLNSVFGAGGFAPGSERVMTVFSGVGSWKTAATGLKNAAVGALKRNAFVALIFSSALSIAEWKADVAKDNYDLATALVMNIIKAIVISVLATLLVAAIVALVLFFSGVAVPVIAVGAMVVAAGVGIAYLVEAADKSVGKMVTGDEKNTGGIADLVTPYLRRAGNQIGESWNYLVKKFPSDYLEFSF